MLFVHFPHVGLLTILAILISTIILRWRRRPLFPLVNNYIIDPCGWKANADFATNAATLISEGLAKHQGPITLATPMGPKIVLPASLSGWVKSNRNLDHRELARKDFYAGMPGFEGQTVLHSLGDTLLDVIKTKLGQNDSTIPIMNKSLEIALRIHWTDEKAWHTLDWQKDTTAIIARAASSVFVGPEKANDPEWLNLVQGYAGAYFSAVSELHGYPSWSRSVVQSFLSSATTCRRYVVQARKIMNEEICKRQEAARNAEFEGQTPPEYNDAIAWILAASNRQIEAGDIQLALAIAAMLTTSELFRQVLIDVASHPELIESLRTEASQQIAKHGISVAATSNMALLDSVIKESQRQSSAIVCLERVVLKDVILPNGIVIPRGSHIMVDSMNLWDSSIYPNPDQFDGYRFLRKREAGDKLSQFVQSGPDYNVFGGGRHICPGRFFANNALKFAMAHVLLKYDIRMAKGYQSKPLQMGVNKVVDPIAQVEIRERGAAAASILR